MASKNKAKGGKPKNSKEDDEDWEVILAAEALANGATAAAQLKKEASKVPEVASPPATGEDGVDGSDDEEDDDAAETGAKKVCYFRATFHLSLQHLISTNDFTGQRQKEEKEKDEER